MAYFPDLSPYCYGPFAAGELNVGWLDSEHEFGTEPPSDQLLDALWQLVAHPKAASFGLHECDLCPRDPDFEARRVEAQAMAAASGRAFGSGAAIQWPEDARSRAGTACRHGVKRGLGSAEIRVTGEHGEIYAAPDLIYHYVADHHYKAPDAFVCAVLLAPALSW